MIPPKKRFVLVATGELKNGVPSGKVGWATRVGDKLTIANEWEARLKERPSTTVWIGFAFALLLALLPGEAVAQTRYPATLVRVIDADTYVLRVDLGFDVSYTATIRLADLDTPERFTPEGRLATAAADAALKSGPITVAPTGKMTFARHVAHVYVNGRSLADTLLVAGHRKKPPE